MLLIRNKQNEQILAYQFILICFNGMLDYYKELPVLHRSLRVLKFKS